MLGRADGCSPRSGFGPVRSTSPSFAAALIGRRIGVAWNGLEQNWTNGPERRRAKVGTRCAQPPLQHRLPGRDGGGGAGPGGSRRQRRRGARHAGRLLPALRRRVGRRAVAAPGRRRAWSSTCIRTTPARRPCRSPSRGGCRAPTAARSAARSTAGPIRAPTIPSPAPTRSSSTRPEAALHAELELPCVTEVQLAAFAHELAVFADADAYAEANEGRELPYAAESFIPSGLFVTGDEPEPAAEAFFTGTVLAARGRMNETTGDAFWWARVRTLGGEIEIVADPVLLPARSPPAPSSRGRSGSRAGCARSDPAGSTMERDRRRAAAPSVAPRAGAPGGARAGAARGGAGRPAGGRARGCRLARAGGRAALLAPARSPRLRRSSSPRASSSRATAPARASPPARTARGPRRAAPSAGAPGRAIDLFPGTPDLVAVPAPRLAGARCAGRSPSARRRPRLRRPRRRHPRCAPRSPSTWPRARRASPTPATTLVTPRLRQAASRLVLDVLRARGARRIGAGGPGLHVAAGGRRGRAGLERRRRAGRRGRHRHRRAARARTRTPSSSRPAHQFPLGARPRRPSGAPSCSRGRASATRLLIEDDYDAEFRYDREPVGALQGLAPDRVDPTPARRRKTARARRCGSAGSSRRRRSSTPLRRGGAGAGRAAARARPAGARRRCSRPARVERHVRACARALPRAPRGAAVGARGAAARVPGRAASRPGCTRVDRAARRRRRGRLVAEAERRGVRAYPLASSRIECDEPRGLVLGYANASERELREAVEVLAAAISSRAPDAVGPG